MSRTLLFSVQPQAAMKTFRLMLIIAWTIVFPGLLLTTAQAVSFSEEKRPDGTVIRTKTITPYIRATPAGVYIIIGAGVLVGGGIAYLGVRIIARAAELGSKEQAVDLTVDLSQKSVKITRIAQGSFIVLIGGSMVVYAMYLLAS